MGKASQIKLEFPISIGGTLTLENLGVISTKPAFHTQLYIYPVGYRARKRYTSYIDPTEKVDYICEVHDVGGRPQFTVQMEGNSEILEGSSPTNAIRSIVSRINKIRGPASKLAVSGTEFFGFYNEEVQQYIQQLPGAEKITVFPPTHSKKVKTKRKFEAAFREAVKELQKNDPEDFQLVEKVVTERKPIQKIVTSDVRSGKKVKAEPPLPPGPITLPGKSRDVGHKSHTRPHDKRSKSVHLPQWNAAVALTYEWTTSPLPTPDWAPKHKRSRRVYYGGFRKGGVIFQVGDFCLLNPPDGVEEPYIGRIMSMFEKIKRSGASDSCIDVHWFSRPSDLAQMDKLQLCKHTLRIEEPISHPYSSPAACSPDTLSDIAATDRVEIVLHSQESSPALVPFTSAVPRTADVMQPTAQSSVLAVREDVQEQRTISPGASSFSSSEEINLNAGVNDPPGVTIIEELSTMPKSRLSGRPPRAAAAKPASRPVSATGKKKKRPLKYSPLPLASLPSDAPLVCHSAPLPTLNRDSPTSSLVCDEHSRSSTTTFLSESSVPSTTDSLFAGDANDTVAPRYMPLVEGRGPGFRLPIRPSVETVSYEKLALHLLKNEVFVTDMKYEMEGIAAVIGKCYVQFFNNGTKGPVPEILDDRFHFICRRGVLFPSENKNVIAPLPAVYAQNQSLFPSYMGLLPRPVDLSMFVPVTLTGGHNDRPVRISRPPQRTVDDFVYQYKAPKSERMKHREPLEIITTPAEPTHPYPRPMEEDYVMDLIRSDPDQMCALQTDQTVVVPAFRPARILTEYPENDRLLYPAPSSCATAPFSPLMENTDSMLSAHSDSHTPSGPTSFAALLSVQPVSAPVSQVATPVEPVAVQQPPPPPAPTTVSARRLTRSTTLTPVPPLSTVVNARALAADSVVRSISPLIAATQRISSPVLMMVQTPPSQSATQSVQSPASKNRKRKADPVVAEEETRQHSTVFNPLHVVQGKDIPFYLDERNDDDDYLRAHMRQERWQRKGRVPLTDLKRLASRSRKDTHRAALINYEIMLAD